jgi:hypothetical protein
MGMSKGDTNWRRRVGGPNSQRRGAVKENKITNGFHYFQDHIQNPKSIQPHYQHYQQNDNFPPVFLLTSE